ncbi:MAG: sigma-70 family RNA polymerase sigma factor [Planctomycetota bacterium]
MTTALADRDLLRRYVDGDDGDAFAGLVRRHAPLVFHTCLRVLGDRDRAEDAAQETFHRLMRHPEKVNHSLAAWLHRVATRCAIDILRSDTARRRRELVYQQRAERRRAPAEPWPSVSARLDEALARLNPAQRELLVEHFLNGRTQADLARSAGCSKATLSRRMSAAVDAMRERMGLPAAAVGGTGVAALLSGLSTPASAAVPPTLTAELNKMALLGGAQTGPAGAVVQLGPWTFKLASLAAVGGAGACVSLGLLVYLLATHPAVSPLGGASRAAVESVQAALAEPAEAEPAADSPGLVYVRRPGESLRSDHVLAYTADGRDVSVVFADSHVRSMDLREARPLIEAQAGLTLEQLAARAGPRP